MPSETITDKALLREIIWDDAEGYAVVREEITGTSRWTVHIETVFKRIQDDKLFITYWAKGATENQDHEFPELAKEAEAHAVTLTHYRVKR